MFRNYQVFLSAFVIFLCDCTSKLWVVSFLAPVSKISVFDGILSFCYMENTGAAFSLLRNHIFFLKIFSLITVCGIIFYFLRSKKTFSFFYKLAWGLVLGGSLGNLADRIFRGYVVDFISVDFVNFAVFNIADAAVNIGVVMLIISLLQERKNAV